MASYTFSRHLRRVVVVWSIRTLHITQFMLETWPHIGFPATGRTLLLNILSFGLIPLKAPDTKWIGSLAQKAMDQDKSHAESESRRGRNPSGADSRIGHIFPSEVRAVLSVLGEHLQHSPDATEIARLTTSAAPDPDVYLLFFGDVYLGTITRQPGKNTGDADDFMHTPPGRGHV